jgi:hypothetical protein
MNRPSNRWPRSLAVRSQEGFRSMAAAGTKRRRGVISRCIRSASASDRRPSRSPRSLSRQVIMRRPPALHSEHLRMIPRAMKHTDVVTVGPIVLTSFAAILPQPQHEHFSLLSGEVVEAGRSLRPSGAQQGAVSWPVAVLASGCVSGRCSHQRIVLITAPAGRRRSWPEAGPKRVGRADRLQRGEGRRCPDQVSACATLSPSRRRRVDGGYAPD